MTINWRQYPAALWRGKTAYLKPISALNPVQLDDLIGIDGQKQGLLENTQRFMQGQTANHALLWGARGTGKSSLIRALLNTLAPKGLRIIQFDKADLIDLPEVVDSLREQPFYFIIYCDDFAFAEGDASYQALKTLLDGSIEAPPDNLLIYATSNRRHLMPETMRDNLDSRIIEGELHYADAIEDKISLADRFGLWLAFHPSNQAAYLKMVDHYFNETNNLDQEQLHAAAKLFAHQRGCRSGRTAQQFYNYYAPRLKTD